MSRGGQTDSQAGIQQLLQAEQQAQAIVAKAKQGARCDAIGLRRAAALTPE